MTSICVGGGASQAKSGFGRTIYMAPAMLGAFLNNIPTAWAVVLAGYIGSITYDLATFCTTDPPALPTFTADDVTSLLTPSDIVNWIPARQKFQDLIGYFLWFQMCECVSGAQPTPSAAPAAPTNIPLVNPPAVAPTYPTGQACGSYDFPHLTLSGTGTTYYHTDVLTSEQSYGAVDIVAATRQTDPTATFRVGGEWFTSGGVSLGSFIAFVNDPSRFHGEGARPANASEIRWFHQVSGGSATPIGLDVVGTLYCGGAPGSSSGPVPVPCPTDPFTIGLLSQILDLVTLIQRQAVPFASIHGAAHTGLSGDGHFAVQGLLGCIVTLTSIPSNVGLEDGDPLVYFEAGWINWGNADGSTSRELIRCSPQTSYPAAAGQYTRIGYSLPPGVTATITEIRREA